MKTYIKQTFGTIAVATLTALITVFVVSKNKTNEPATVKQVTQVPALYSSMPVTPAINTDFTNAAESAVQAVVHVKVKVSYKSNTIDLYDLLLGNGPREQIVEGSGSGVIISSDGYIVTNNHVIDKSSDIEVVLNDKRRYDARLVGTDPTTDIALLKVDANGLPSIPFGNSDNLKLGEWVLAVGNPFNLSTTVTAGIVSAKARGIGILSNENRLGIESFIQTDAVVNRGNSGGALVNTNGDLVGINSAIASPTGAYAGYSFAVPVSIVKKIVADLMEFGEAQRAFLGISMMDIDARLAEKMELDNLKGVYVSEIVDNSAAQDAGIKEGDVITGINGNEVNSGSEVQEQLSRFRPGDKVSVQLYRKGDVKSISVTLKNRHGNTKMIQKNEMVILGAEFEALTAEELSQKGLKNGVRVVNAGNGKLKQYGISNGYIITKINDRAVNSVDDINDIMATVKGGLFISGIYPNGKKAYYAINLDE